MLTWKKSCPPLAAPPWETRTSLLYQLDGPLVVCRPTCEVLVPRGIALYRNGTMAHIDAGKITTIKRILYYVSDARSIA